MPPLKRKIRKSNNKRVNTSMSESREFIETLSRIDERVVGVQNSLTSLASIVAALEKDLRTSYVKKDELSSINETLKGYIRQDEFRPVKNLVFGFVGVVLTAVVVSLITLVIRSSS